MGKQITELGEEVQKNIDRLNMIVYTIVTLFSIYSIIHFWVHNTGEKYLYIGIFILGAMLCLGLTFMILFFSKFIKKDLFRRRYIVLMAYVLVVIIFAGHYGSKYFMDIFTGAQCTTTNQYNLGKYNNSSYTIYFIDDEDREMGVSLTNKQKDRLIQENPKNEECPLVEIRDEFYGNYVKDIAIEYYAHTGILKRITIEG